MEEDLIPGVTVIPSIKDKMPALYIIGQANLLFTVKEFVLINLEAVVCAVIIYFIGSAA